MGDMELHTKKNTDVGLKWINSTSIADKLHL